MVVGSCCESYVNLLWSVAERMLVSNSDEYRKYLYKGGCIGNEAGELLEL